jgi:hypothetical protein
MSVRVLTTERMIPKVTNRDSNENVDIKYSAHDRVSDHRVCN